MTSSLSIEGIKNSEKDQVSNGIQKIIPDDYLISIGRVITQWSSLEEIVSCAIWQTLEVSRNVGVIITAQLQMMSKLDLLATLLHEKHPELAPQFDKALNYIKGNLIGRRNFVTHGWWVSGGEEMAFVRKFAAKGKPAPKDKLMTKADLLKLSQEIAETSFWMMTLCAVLPELIRKPSSQDQKLKEYYIQLLRDESTQNTPPPPPLNDPRLED